MAAAGKEQSVSLSLFMDVKNLRLRMTYPLWQRSFWQKVCGWEEEERACRSTHLRKP